MILLEHNFRHNAVVSTVTLKSIMFKFSSIMYLTLLRCLKGMTLYFLSNKGRFVEAFDEFTK